ncbi:alpha/beta hydrolase [Mucilaginibacter conchicola]|uniref:Alpha/beta hydrolase n=1 Tax=Mucilaginibacter conchicola TaxID=2303333 RepID=A0A372NMU8_9SPHI|nr:alpha/beta hydrolase [Mucilaginibacter conchicola]RFZ90279.1 alpha/beta hydrolase [Mucilaginibacter conchicola]
MLLNREITGDGEHTIVFIHGNSQSLHTWDKVIYQDALSNYTKITIDLPGHGLSFKSKRPQIDYTISGFASTISNFLEVYRDRKYILVGTSLGTSIISALDPFPKACSGVFLSAAMLSTKNISVKDMMQPNPTGVSGFKAVPSDEEIDQFIDRLIFCAGPEIKQHYKEVFKQTDSEVRACLSKSSVKPPEFDRIKNLMSANIPVAVVYGAQEALVQSDYLKKTDLKLWRNNIFKIDNAGHCIELDQPEALAGLIREFATYCFS